MKKILLLSLLVLFGCSKESEEDKLFTDKTRSKKYTRADLIQKYNNGTNWFLFNAKLLTLK